MKFKTNIGCSDYYDCMGCQYYYACAREEIWLNDIKIEDANYEEIIKEYKLSKKQKEIIRRIYSSSHST